MSDREKKLLLFFGIAIFLLVNFFGYSLFQEQKTKISRSLIEAKGKVDLANATAGSFDTVRKEIEWLGKHYPEPKPGALVGTELQQEADRQATTHQLTVKRRVIKPNDESGVRFHRAKVEFNVTGREESFYRWLDRMQDPDRLRAVTFVRVLPDAKDDTLVDATVEIDQWFVPDTGDGTEFTPENDAPVEGAGVLPDPPPVSIPGSLPGAEVPAPSQPGTE